METTRRVYPYRIQEVTMNMIDALPEGITHPNPEPLSGAMMCKASVVEVENDKVIIGRFHFDLKLVSYEDIKKLRPYLPSNSYSMLKNRLGSRHTRARKKTEILGVKNCYNQTQL